MKTPLHSNRVILVMIVEVCANSYQSALNAQKAGAHRIELCAELALGGLTPSYGLLKKVMSVMHIPVHVLIRPRSGDFTYSDTEFDIMKENIRLGKSLGCAGIVSGILYNDHTVDLKRTKELVELSKPLLFTFHKAFDWVKNPIDAIVALEKIGVQRVLTSGQENTAEKGLILLNTLKQRTGMTILPGGGINAENIHRFIASGFTEVHLSASKQIKTMEVPKVSMNNPRHFDETQLSFSDVKILKKVLVQIKKK